MPLLPTDFFRTAFHWSIVLDVLNEFSVSFGRMGREGEGGVRANFSGISGWVIYDVTV